MTDISACILAKNEAHCIRACIEAIKPFVSEVLVIDDNSTDNTIEIATSLGARVINYPFSIKESGFAEAWNWMIFQATNEWVLILDADELIPEARNLDTLTRYPGKGTWALPRRKWIEYPTSRIEYERYPDWQERFLKRNINYKFEGLLHVRYNSPKINYAFRGPHIEHLQHQNRTENKIELRNTLYQDLANRQGVKIFGGEVEIQNE